MKTYNLLILLTFTLIFTSCKKENATSINEELRLISDSVSFTINNKSYFFDSQNEIGIGNRQINIKPSISQISGRNAAYITGGFYWYGEPDSTLYDISYGLVENLKLQSFKISFSKKYKNDQLIKYFSILMPQNNSDILKVGKQKFAVDFKKENTKEGVSLEFRSRDHSGTLSTYIPGFSILVKANLTKNIQDNSTFEIVKVQKVDEIYHMIEAKFSLNLFDENAKLYRLENGFLRFKVKINS